MKSITFKLLLKDASKNVKSHATTSISSIVTVMLSLFILELFVLSVLNLKLGIFHVYSYPEVRVTLKNDIDITDQQNIYKKIKESNVATHITFENDTSSSPAYIIEVNESDGIPKITSQLNELQGINKINAGQGIPINTSVLLKLIQFIGVLLFLILMVAIFFLIKHTMKIAIYTRLNEINIMQYLGATDWFVKLPFIFEGMLIGFFGAVFSILALYFLYSLVYRQVYSSFEITFISFISPSFIFTTLSWSFILIGILLTTIASILVIKKLLIV